MNKAGRYTTKIIIGIIFAIYVLVLLVALFFKFRGGSVGFFLNSQPEPAKYIRLNTNFIPFKTIGGYIKSLADNTISFNIVMLNLLGNMILFLPMGLFLPFYFKKLRTFGKYILTIIIMVILAELIQFLFVLGSADIDDFILNVGGGAIGYALRKLKPVQRVCRKIEG